MFVLLERLRLTSQRSFASSFLSCVLPYLIRMASQVTKITDVVTVMNALQLWLDFYQGMFDGKINTFVVGPQQPGKSQSRHFLRDELKDLRTCSTLMGVLPPHVKY